MLVMEMMARIMETSVMRLKVRRNYSERPTAGGTFYSQKYWKKYADSASLGIAVQMRFSLAGLRAALSWIAYLWGQEYLGAKISFQGIAAEN
jgi:hypothetical protein